MLDEADASLAKGEGILNHRRIDEGAGRRREDRRSGVENAARVVESLTVLYRTEGLSPLPTMPTRGRELFTEDRMHQRGSRLTEDP